ncbi:MAG: membrane protein insertion efficiency factor YidD [Methylococcaceae bacterium]|nr:membrane protein insertion efficiency factor YidD [Methylococcaceae bacterium]
MLSKIAIRCIDRYQRKGGGNTLLYVDCNFSPTCSEYAKLSISRFGFFRGVFLGIKRISRCNHRDLVGQISDPVPDVLVREGKSR